MKNVGIIAGLFTIFIHFVASMGLQDEIYIIYSKIIFPVIRKLYDTTIGLLPFPSIYIVFVALMLFLPFLVFRFIKSTRNQNFRSSIYKGFLILLNFVGWIYFFFYFLWAFNYFRPTVDTKLHLPKIYIDSSILNRELKIVTEKINDIRPLLKHTNRESIKQSDDHDLEDTIRELQVNLLQNWGDKVTGRVRIRYLYPKGLLLRISTAGVYIPYSFEGHIDPGLNQIQWPFTMAHEMAHGYGYTDEGECNFIGFLTCIRSKDLFIQYSGWLSYWRYLYFQVKEFSPSSAEEVYCNLDMAIMDDLKAIRSDLNKYPDLFPRVRDAIYEYYLKSHGIDEGLNSYNGIISLVLRWKELNPDEVK